jgi:diacylglycerol kinase family enzyme
MSQRDVCVIFNPTSGKGRASRRLQRLDDSGQITLHTTQAPGHGLELARQAALDGFTTIVAAGGDGTVHEVANGILLAKRPKVRFGIIPIGSANDYHASLLMDATADRSGLRTVDVGVVRGPEGKEKYFLCCLGLGFNGTVTLESRKIKRLQGIALYGLATLRALWRHYRCPRLEFAFDDQPPVIAPSLMLSVLVGKREGGFVLAPKARLDDGWLDYVHAGELSRWEVLRFLPRLALLGPPEHHPKVRQGQCKKLRLKSEEPLVVHIDGEFFCVPEEKVQELDIEIQPASLLVDLNVDLSASANR